MSNGETKQSSFPGAEEILLAREAHFPATIADLYDPEKMPADLRAAHDRNDETLERIYLGRRFKNDTERLEKLFELYTKMTANAPAKKAAKKATGRKKPGKIRIDCGSIYTKFVLHEKRDNYFGRGRAALGEGLGGRARHQRFAHVGRGIAPENAVRATV